MARVYPVQVSAYQIVLMAGVRDALVTAIRSMCVRRVVRAAGVLGRAAVGIRRVRGEGVLVDVFAVD
jgi:hypothetical protein